jgi:hypothetical protein
MNSRTRKLLQMPLPVLAQVAVRRLRLKWSSVVQRTKSVLPASRLAGVFRNDRAFFCCSDIRERRAKFLSILESRYPGSIQSNVGQADKVMAHRFDLLGSGEVSLGQKIDWHRDFKSGKVWPVVYFEDIPEVDLSDSSDIKVTWELSRLYHFVTLGKAYTCTRNEEYTVEFLDQLADWIQNNPPRYGVNWRLAMEVAIRAINLCWSYFLFRDSVLFTPVRKSQLSALLLAHGRFIQNNLEDDRRVIANRLQRMNGNHYLANLAGLIYLGVLLEGKEPEAWLQFALAEMDRELEIQVLSDGMHWELSPSYHRLVLEMLLGCAVLCSANSIDLPKGLQEKLRAMLRCTQEYLTPQGLCPLVGDADDGRITPLGRTQYRDHRHLLAVGALLFYEGEVPAGILQCSEDALWLFGVNRHQHLHAATTVGTKPTSHAFPNAGYYVLRAVEDLYVFVVCTSGGMNGNNAGHAHNDCLSFELFWRSLSFLTDSGTYSYSGAPLWRNRFRSTAFHNTARVDEQEINRFSESSLFFRENDARPLVKKWGSADCCDELEAEHYGYTRLREPIVHSRKFVLDKPRRILSIEDCFEGTGDHLFEIFFTVHPDCVVTECDRSLIQLSHAGDIVLLYLVDGYGWNWGWAEGWISEMYGCKRATRKLVFSRRGCAPCSLRMYAICTSGTLANPLAAAEAAVKGMNCIERTA